VEKSQDNPTEIKDEKIDRKKIGEKLTEVVAKATIISSTHSENMESQEVDKLLKDEHDVQDPKVDFGWTTFNHPEPKYTTLVKVKDAKYTISEDYPTTKGEIDEFKNFWK